MHVKKHARFLILGFVAVLLVVIIACGEEATPTVAPTATDSPDLATTAPTAAQAAPSTSAPASTTAPTVAARVTATPAAIPTPTAAPSMMEPQGTLRVAMSEVGPAVFNNRDATYATHRFIMTTVGEAMFQNNLDGETVGRLVKDWTVTSTPNGVTYTFNLQPGAKWHTEFSNGDWGEFNADDFLFNIDLVTDDRSVHAIKPGTRRAYKCEECELTKVDDLTVQLKRPSESFEVFWYTRQPAGALLSFQSKRHIDARGEEAATLEPVYSGPWEIVDFATGEFYLMRGVEDHWRKTPEWEFMNWQGIAEESTRIANFLTANIDTGKFGLEAIRELKDAQDPDHKFLSFPGGITNRIQIFGQIHSGPDDLDGGQPGEPAATHVPDSEGNVRAKLADGYFDCSHPFIPCDRDTSSAEWLKALKVRLALNYAIDRQKLVNNLTYGEGQPSYLSNWGGHELRYKQQGLEELVHPFDVPQAQQLIREAGYPDGFEVEMVHPDLFPQGEVGATAVCVMWLEALNVRCNEKNVPYSSFRPTLVVRNFQGFYSHGLGQAVEPLWLMQLFYDVGGGFNYGFEHPDFQDMIDNATSLNNDEERWKATADMSRWLFDNAMLVNMYAEPLILPIGPRIDEWPILPGPVVDFNSYEYVPHRQ